MRLLGTRTAPHAEGDPWVLDVAASTSAPFFFFDLTGYILAYFAERHFVEPVPIMASNEKHYFLSLVTWPTWLRSRHQLPHPKALYLKVVGILSYPAFWVAYCNAAGV
jgi:hypothetical protein